jgi:hypothetical protein
VGRKFCGDRSLKRQQSNFHAKMGKKKSKISKQKQAKAKKRHASSLGGVAVSKGSSSKFQQSRLQQTHSVILRGNQSASTQNSKKSATLVDNNQNSQLASHKINRKELMKKLSQKKSHPKVFFSPASKVAAPANSRVALHPRLGSIREDEEQQEFEQQLASLQERQWVADQKCGSKKRNNMVVGNSSFDHSSSGIFAIQPASFQVEKTTQDLLQETMHKMVHMTGVGISAVERTPIRSNRTVESQKVLGVSLPTQPQHNISSGIAPPSTLSSLAAASHRQQEERKQFIQEHSSENPFTALGTGDSDDEDQDDCNINKPTSYWSLKIQPPSNFNFAPASFSLMPRQTPTPASTPIPTHRQLPHRHLPTIHSCSFVAASANTVTAANDPASEQEIDPDL